MSSMSFAKHFISLFCRYINRASSEGGSVVATDRLFMNAVLDEGMISVCGSPTDMTRHM